MGFVSKEKFAVEVGKRIKKYREEAGMSQEELAHKCEMYRTYIGHLENGRYSPSAYILMKIAKSLKTPIQNLYP
ncbi:transcriptional regulator [candidate division WWE3 bacterium CG10_big_fil_rev_8_21_14_0_10_32_10]|uniref:Transcriptional regulator n=1 Tax=candidate division WWE3 bacterium CG10_big_fil_rev_8_21_14_0_10_32_10 TaxID=1975090 RepID=A0A2H0RBI1_UNCKA|nr:MAG: transcriptional regulator [candidate division WWE3 bacterium CG10_big_fil_rev_8_21_14_0_10_32_10]